MVIGIKTKTGRGDDEMTTMKMSGRARAAETMMKRTRTIARAAGDAMRTMRTIGHGRDVAGMRMMTTMRTMTGHGDGATMIGKKIRSERRNGSSHSCPGRKLLPF